MLEYRRKGCVFMDKICKAIVVKMLSLGIDCECSLSENREDDGFTCALGEIASELEINFQTALKTVDYLVQTGYAKYIPRGTPRSGTQNAAFQLTFQGVQWKSFRRREIFNYIADKWVDILSSIISVISLTVSIIALWQVR